MDYTGSSSTSSKYSDKDAVIVDADEYNDNWPFSTITRLFATDDSKAVPSSVSDRKTLKDRLKDLDEEYERNRRQNKPKAKTKKRPKDKKKGTGDDKKQLTGERLTLDDIDSLATDVADDDWTTLELRREQKSKRE